MSHKYYWLGDLQPLIFFQPVWVYFLIKVSSHVKYINSYSYPQIFLRNLQKYSKPFFDERKSSIITYFEISLEKKWLLKTWWRIWFILLIWYIFDEKIRAHLHSLKIWWKISMVWINQHRRCFSFFFLVNLQKLCTNRVSIISN